MEGMLLIIYPEKTYTDNPFVDNAAYYAKMLAMNCTIKDKEEADNAETKDSLDAGDVLIACIEGSASYEIFENIPKEILENYIAIASNLDIYSKDPQWLANRLASFKEPERNKILARLSTLAQSTYIDHYDIMTKYIQEAGPNWLSDNLELYEACKSGSATYMDLFDHLPMKTALRIIRAYLNSHGYIDLAVLWDPDAVLTKLDLAAIEKAAKENIASDSYSSKTYDEAIKAMLLDTDYITSLPDYDASNSTYKNQFLGYIHTRDDENILNELAQISQAMREVFMSHYEHMKMRGYFNSEAEENVIILNYEEDGTPIYAPAWMGFYFDAELYRLSKNGTAIWQSLYTSFPNFAMIEIAQYLFGPNFDIGLLTSSYEDLEEYIKSLPNANAMNKALSARMRDVYISNYQFYLNRSIYFMCKNNLLTIYDLYEYLPQETLKAIINTEIPQTTNLQAFSQSKTMLNSWLHTLDREEAQTIKDAITRDMIVWYPKNHVEENNYYRALIGLPPLDSKNEPLEDTLLRSYDDTNKVYIDLGTTFISRCPTDIYPESHWRQPLYKFDNYDISILMDLGIIEEYAQACGSDINSTRYKYLKYLGEDKLDLYTCRKADNFAIIGLPSIDNQEIRDKFVDKYAINLDYVIRNVYSDAYKFQSEYYNKFIILFLLFNTTMDVILSIPDYMINRDGFDARCIKYLFSASGIPYYDEIPLKYQKAMLKNLNILIKYKSSTRNMVDICNLFGFHDIRVFGYYMMKDRSVDSAGNYIPDEINDIAYELDDIYIKYSNGDITDVSGYKFIKLTSYPYYNEEYYTREISILDDDGKVVKKRVINTDRDDLYVYDKENNEMIPLKDSTYFKTIGANTDAATLKFVKVPIEESLTAYKNDEDYINEYDEITTEITWDGGWNHEELKRRILNHEFNAVKSKYISIDSITNLTEIAFQTSYFYNMLFDNAYNEDLLTVKIPYLKQNHEFRLTDIIFFLFALTYYYAGLKDKIMYSPTQILFVKGYNFDRLINLIMQDSRFYSQTDSDGYTLSDSEKENIFNVNTRIAEDNYDYRALFAEMGLKVKGFNLEADIDALEKWMNLEWQMSLDDFIVSSDVDTYGQIVTLRQFYSLHNSYYQKKLFTGNLIPLQYNNVIKYAYGGEVVAINSINDINDIPHMYITETSVDLDSPSLYDFILDVVALVSKSTGLYTYNELLDRVKSASSYASLEKYAYILEDLFGVDDTIALADLANKIKSEYYYMVINSTSDEIYIYDYTTYAELISDSSKQLALYKHYKRNVDNDFEVASKQFYYYNQDTDTYNMIVSGYVYVRNSDGIYTFATDKVYVRNSNDIYVEIDYDRYSHIDKTENVRILHLGEYYILDENGNYILNPENCYIKTTDDDGNEVYMLFKNIDGYVQETIDENECYIMDDNGHFIKFEYTDYYIRTHNDTDNMNQMIYKERDLYVQVDYETDIYDEMIPGVYYRKLEDFYNDNLWISTHMLYVKDLDGNYLPESQILQLNNCWYYDSTSDEYKLVVSSQYVYKKYNDPLEVLYLLILQSNNDYDKYAYESSTQKYIDTHVTDSRYMVHNNHLYYLTTMDNNATYSDTKTLLIVFNEQITEDVLSTLEAEGYNASLHDGVWDENDWYYEHPGTDENNVIGMNGENIWYYRNPKIDTSNVSDHGNSSTSTSVLGSGVYFNAESYLGDIELTEGETYYLSMYVETNFDGDIQIYCTADSSVLSSVDRVYTFKAGERQKIVQTFTCNSNVTPQIRFIKYDFANNPIYVGDYIKIMEFEFNKSYNENYVPTNIPSIDDLERIYKTNRAIYRYLLTQMYNTSDKKTYDMYKKLYDSLMTVEYNKEVFRFKDGTYALTYTDFLGERDSVLYKILEELKTMETEAMKTQISNYIIEICYVLNELLSGRGLDSIYSYFPAVSTSFIQQYLYKVINWFKSWKVHLLGINTLYRMGNGVIKDSEGNIIFEADGDDFNVKILYDKSVQIHLQEYKKEPLVRDTIKINPLDSISPDGTPYAEKYDFSDCHLVFRDNVGVKDRIRMFIQTGNKIVIKNNRIAAHLNDNTTTIEVLDGNQLLIHTINGDEFTIDGNKLHIHTNEDVDDTFISQIIDEITLLSGDYINYESLEEDDNNE